MAQITLSQGKIVQIDDEDFDFLNQWKWFALKGKYTYYAVRNIRTYGRQKMIYMHRIILNISNINIRIDHLDYDGLNNKKNNLRVATISQNNSYRHAKKTGVSKYLGVCFRKDLNSWVARIKKDGSTKHLGHFKREIDAALAYNRKAIELHGEFASLNKITA